jgi:hypothetical protein
MSTACLRWGKNSDGVSVSVCCEGCIFGGKVNPPLKLLYFYKRGPKKAVYIHRALPIRESCLTYHCITHAGSVSYVKSLTWKISTIPKAEASTPTMSYPANCYFIQVFFLVQAGKK